MATCKFCLRIKATRIICIIVEFSSSPSGKQWPVSLLDESSSVKVSDCVIIIDFPVEKHDLYVYPRNQDKDGTSHCRNCESNSKFGVDEIPFYLVFFMDIFRIKSSNYLFTQFFCLNNCT